MTVPNLQIKKSFACEWLLPEDERAQFLCFVLQSYISHFLMKSQE